jgi:hypothetical protein
MKARSPSGLAEMIEDARRTIAGWPPEVRRALGLPDGPECEHEWVLKSGSLDCTGEHYTDQCTRCPARRVRNVGRT